MEVLSIRASEGQAGIGQAGDHKEALSEFRDRMEKGEVMRAESPKGCIWLKL